MISSKLLVLPSIPRTSTQFHQSAVKQHHVQSTPESWGQKEEERGEGEGGDDAVCCLRSPQLAGNRHTSQVNGKEGELMPEGGAWDDRQWEWGEGWLGKDPR